jgi:hypothetical protein
VETLFRGLSLFDGTLLKFELGGGEAGSGNYADQSSDYVFCGMGELDCGDRRNGSKNPNWIGSVRGRKKAEIRSGAANLDTSINNLFRSEFRMPAGCWDLRAMILVGSADIRGLKEPLIKMYGSNSGLGAGAAKAGRASHGKQVVRYPQRFFGPRFCSTIFGEQGDRECGPRRSGMSRMAVSKYEGCLHPKEFPCVFAEDFLLLLVRNVRCVRSASCTVPGYSESKWG